MRVTNVAPVITSLAATSVEENGVVHLTGTYTDVGTQDTHTLTIDWGEGAPQQEVVTGGSFDITHRYLDDNPTGTASDVYRIHVTLADDDTGTDAGSTTTTISNVLPVVAQVDDQRIHRNHPLVLENLPVTFTDAGTLDTHTCTVHWGDGTSGSCAVVEPTGGNPGRMLATHAYGEAGTYTVTVTVTDDDTGQGVMSFKVDVFAGEVVGRHVFYNNSAWDGNDPGAGASDDNAIAPAPPRLDPTDPTYPGDSPKQLGKTALLPCETATFANYTTYSKGLNGIMIDIAGLVATPNLDDFIFKVGNSNDVSSWTAAPAPQAPVVRWGAGVDDSDRITLIWADDDPYTDQREPGSISNQWLQITVRATDNTGLEADHVFYFGNAIAESGNSTLETNVDTNDEIGARNHPHSAFSPASIDDAYDYDRDKKVDTNDEIIARNNPASAFDRLVLITAPCPSRGESGLGGGADGFTRSFAGSTVDGAKDGGLLRGNGSVPNINVGEHVLLPNTPSQVIAIPVAGGEAVQGVVFNLQVANGYDAVPGSTPDGDGPNITGVDLIGAGTVFGSAGNTGHNFIARTPQMWIVGTSTSSGTVSADGILAYVTLDTTGWFPGSGPWVLLVSQTFNGDTNFQSPSGQLIPTVTNGLIRIEQQGVPWARQFDFNAGGNVTAAGYEGVPVSKRYTPGSGSDFGWDSAARPLASFDRYGPNALLRDGHYGYDGTFLLDVPDAGPYVVTMVIGDTAPFYHDRIEVLAEGTSRLMVSTTPGQWSMPSFVVSAGSDHVLSLRLRDTGGVDPHYVINALRVRSLALARTITVTPPGPGAPLDADGTTVDEYFASGATPGALVTVASSLGTVLASQDVSPTIQGVQLWADAAGSFCFQIQRPSGLETSPATATITAQEVEGTGLGQGVQEFQSIADPETVLRFDFNASNLMTAPGFTGVGPRDLYTTTRGYGWSTRVAAADRPDPAMSLLNRDLHTGSNATFRVNVEPGKTYYVRAYLANPLGTAGYRYTYDNFDVIAEGQTLHVDQLIPGTVTTHVFEVTMGAGDTVLDVQFVDRGGQNFNWVVSGMDIWTTVDPGEAALLAEAAGTGAVAGAALSADALAPVVAEAAARWSATGLTAAQTAALAQVRFQVADLGGAYLGLANTAMGVVRIDDDAAGWGWSVIGDRSSVIGGQRADVGGQRSVITHRSPITDDRSPVTGMDLLHVVMHELGHVLGYGHSADEGDLMAPVWSAGTLHPASRIPDLASRIPDLATRIPDLATRVDAAFDDWAGARDGSLQRTGERTAGERLRFEAEGPGLTGMPAAARPDENEDQLWVPRRVRPASYEEAVDALWASWDDPLVIANRCSR